MMMKGVRRINRKARLARNVSGFALTLAGLSTFGASAAIAQTAPATTPPPADQGANSAQAPATPGTATPGDSEGEIVVTAQGRQERLQSVPVSAVVVTEQQRLENNTNNLESLARTNPSIRIQASGRGSDLYIRGTGSGGNQSFDQSVGIFIDDIYHGRGRTTNGNFLDLERVEVLKGPQSTFFGNNAIAGALNIVTQRPTNEFGGNFRILGSTRDGTNGGQYAVEGVVNVPLSDTVDVRIAGTFNGQNGWLTNTTTGDKVPEERTYGARGQIRWRPNADWDINFKAEYTNYRANGSNYYLQNFNCPPPPPFVNAASSFCSQILNAHLPTGLDNTFYNVTDGEVTTLRNQEYVLTASHNIGPFTLTSTTGYYRFNFLLNLDTDGTPAALLHVGTPERYHQFSQEFRIVSPTGHRFEYLAGVYFQRDQNLSQTDFSYFFVSPAIQANPAFAALVPFLPLGQTIFVDQDQRTLSAFGSLTWNATDRLKLSAGVRASFVHKAFDWTLFYGTATQNWDGIVSLPANLQTLPRALGLGTAGNVQLDRNDHAFMPSARIQYQFTPDIMAYASYARGFKAGGFNFANNDANPANYPFDPEHVNAYEIGLKTQWLNHTVTLNLAAFRSDYNDLQVSFQQTTPQGSFLSFVRNAASSRSQGVELEGAWQIVPAFRISSTGTYLDSKYVSYPNAGPTIFQTTQGIGTQDLSGRPTPFSPRWSGNVTGTLVLPVGRFRLTTEATMIFSSFSYLRFNDDPIHVQGSWQRFDGRITLESPDRRWAFDIIGHNLTNAIILLQTADQPRSPGALLGQRLQPSNIAFQLRYRW